MSGFERLRIFRIFDPHLRGHTEQTVDYVCARVSVIQRQKSQSYARFNEDMGEHIDLPIWCNHRKRS